jgi:hypothetical protein
MSPLMELLAFPQGEREQIYPMTPELASLVAALVQMSRFPSSPRPLLALPLFLAEVPVIF